MRHLFVPALTLTLLLCAPAARADGTLDMAWNDCDLGAASATLLFGCTTNNGASDLLVSFIAPPGVTALGSVSITVRLGVPELPCVTRDCPSVATGGYPSWWDFSAGACREGALTVVQPSTYAACPDPWSGNAASGALTSFTSPAGPGATTRELTATIAPTDGGAYALDAGTEYTAMTLHVSHAHTTGVGACPGCAAAMWLVLEEVDLEMKDGSPPVALTGLVHRLGVGWQGDAPVPAGSSTWGALKTRYR